MTRHREHGIAGALSPVKPATLDEGGGGLSGYVLVLKPSTTARPMHQGGILRSREDRWETMPKGWDASSRAKYASSMAGECEDSEHPVSTCIDKIDGHVGDPGAFCAALQDRVSGDTHWRGKK